MMLIDFEDRSRIYYFEPTSGELEVAPTGVNSDTNSGYYEDYQGNPIFFYRFNDALSIRIRSQVVVIDDSITSRLVITDTIGEWLLFRDGKLLYTLKYNRPYVDPVVEMFFQFPEDFEFPLFVHKVLRDSVWWRRIFRPKDFDKVPTTVKIVSELSRYPLYPGADVISFEKMPKEDLERFYWRFIENISQRTALLENAVISNPVYLDWRADRTPKSLNALGNWLVLLLLDGVPEANMEVADDKDVAYSASSNYKLSEQIFSVGVDVGTYLAVTLRHNVPSLGWSQNISDPHNVHFGDPVLGGFKRLGLSPCTMGPYIGARILAGMPGRGDLLRLYNSWIDDVKFG